MTYDSQSSGLPMSSILVISGPSGVGKTTVCDALLASRDVERVITATTRPRRDHELDGVHYFFLSPERFAADQQAGRFIETAEVFGKRYGSPRDQADAILARGHVVLLNIDVQGAASLRSSGYPVVTVFLVPPSMEELEGRLRARQTDSPEVIAGRLKEARHEMSQKKAFDHRVVNDEVARAVAEIRALVAAAGASCG